MREPDFAKAAMLSPEMAAKWYDAVERSMMEFAIVSPLRAAMYIATIGHESAGFVHTREIWGPTPAQRRYEGRADLGNTQPGDGSRYRGRGLIQITGRANYQAVSDGLGVDYINHPEWLERPVDAARCSGWWWKNKGCNEIADSGDFLRLSIRVNGKNKNGLPNGWEDRQRRYETVRLVFGAP
ncbi:glycoside hydrolase family 19 protein [Bordetella muralis]|uniref:glycoside hydrolase family 19 protein n=1 Tax=Bordetella muralis TaxID=1649130 RepID=UPI0039EF036B